MVWNTGYTWQHNQMLRVMADKERVKRIYKAEVEKVESKKIIFTRQVNYAAKPSPAEKEAQSKMERYERSSSKS